MGLPGDMTNATAFWGAAHATPATCITTLGTGTQTCNGNGNGIIGNAGGEGSDPANNERFRFWQQLVNAGLVNGSYTGIGSAGGESQATIGINVPAAKLTNSGWTPVRGSPVTDEANANTFVGRERNVLIIGAQAAANANRPTHEAALKPEEAWGIDLKIDDGKVGVGRVTGRKGLSSCHIWSGTAATAEYNLTNNTIQCSLNIDY